MIDSIANGLLWMIQNPWLAFKLSMAWTIVIAASVGFLFSLHQAFLATLDCFADYREGKYSWQRIKEGFQWPWEDRDHDSGDTADASTNG